MAQAHTEFEGEFEDEYEHEYEVEGEDEAFLSALGGIARSFLGGEGEDELESEYEDEDELEGEFEGEFEDEFETELESEFEDEDEDEYGRTRSRARTRPSSVVSAGLAESPRGRRGEDESEYEDEVEAEEFFKGGWAASSRSTRTSSEPWPRSPASVATAVEARLPEPWPVRSPPAGRRARGGAGGGARRTWRPRP